MLCLMISIFAGCGKKEDKDIEKKITDVVEETGEDNTEPEADITEIIEEDVVGITKDEVKNLKSNILSVDRYAMDELNRFIVGYMSIDYVELDEEAARICPQLDKSLKKFNDARKKKYNDSYEGFARAARKYTEEMFEAAASSAEPVNYANAGTCEDYSFIDVMRVDNVAMSMLITNMSFLGENEPETVYTGVSYDSQTGSELTIKDVIADWDVYKNALEKEIMRKYTGAAIKDIVAVDNPGWVLTPEGVIVYYTEAYVAIPEGGDTLVQINFDEYPEAFNKKYTIAPDEYAIPFVADDNFYMDVDGDLKREAVMYSPMGPEDYEESGEYPTYEIFVNGVPYNNFEEDWFYGYRPYYVHQKGGSYIYVYTEGYEHDFIAVNKFEGDKPICIAKLPGTPFSAENIESTDDEIITRHIVFSNPSVIHDELSFDRNVCGTYKADSEDELEVRYWDICNIDGRYYLDCIGEYDFWAAEIELLDENPYLAGDELRYMVKVYPFSGFSFGGEYQGAGEVMYIASQIDATDKHIELSADNPFFYAVQSMYGVEGVSLHEVQNRNESNKTVPEIIGAWRAVIEGDSGEYDVYAQFDEDGRVNIVRKCESYTPTVYRGIYNIEKKDSIFTGRIEAEAIGMGSQPVADWIFEFDPNSDNPIRIVDEYALAAGDIDMRFQRTEPGKHNRYIHPGPYKRTEEILEMYEEYIGLDESFEYDYPPEYIEAVCNRVRELTSATSYISYGIQDNRRGGVIWIKAMKDVLPSVQITQNWLRYDLGEGSYTDIHGNSFE